MRVKKVLFSKKKKIFFFKKFVYFNYYFNFRKKKKKIPLDLIQNYFSIFKSAPDFVVLSVFVNEH
jgi:hypothetical protein